ncbi:MAG: Nif11-like leader peptide family natural product precursor [Chloroflexi bacterium]|nr:Nif11-like leader peptide family natural product precursor [Chloroflexota bacterium]
MAVETARKFIEDLDRNSALSTQFTIAAPDSLDSVVDFASGKGYVFTKDDLQAALKHYPESTVGRQLRKYVH